ncbi:MAG: hypothetical protein OXH57_04775 [Ekhidna sp.]|nr:hypothetical protein [Ekhidna sp.]
MSIKPAKKANQIQQHESIRIDLVRQFLENQSRELANHTEEIELKKRNEKTGMIMLVRRKESD